MQHRAVELLHQAGRAYPEAWDLYGKFQKERADFRRLPAEQKSDDRFSMDWPDWCWCPIAAAHSILTVTQDPRAKSPFLDAKAVPPELLAPRIGTGALAALGAWRATQGIYRIEPELLKELLATPVTGDIPVEVLRRLPEWCVYIETPGFTLEHWTFEGKMRVEGFFAFLEHDMNDGRAELRFALDFEGPPDHAALAPMMVHLGGTLEDGIAHAVKKMAANMTDPNMLTRTARLYEALVGKLSGMTSLVLYLCAEEAEVPRPTSLPAFFAVTKKGRAIIPAGKPTVHECGTRLGAQLRLAHTKLAAERLAARVGGARYVEPHIRRAHWHTFLTGPRDRVRVPKVKWLPPIPVLLDDVPTVATVRPVKEIRDDV